MYIYIYIYIYCRWSIWEILQNRGPFCGPLYKGAVPVWCLKRDPNLEKFPGTKQMHSRT